MRKELQSLTEVEVKKLLETMRARSTRDWCLFLVGYNHALRANEMASLTLNDVDLENGHIHLVRQKGSLDHQQDILHAKGNRTLDERYALAEWIKERGNNPQSDILFPSRKTGKKLDRFQINHLFSQYCELAAIPKSKSFPHVLKHSRAYHLLAHGANIPQVQRALGHKSQNSTLRYLHVTDEQASKALQDLQTAMA